MRGLFRAALAVVALFAVGSFAMAADPIKIGAVLSVTGPAAFLGEPELKTLQMYVEKTDAEGGLLGRRIELVSYDDGSEAARANSFTKRLIEDDHVDVLIGGSTTGATMGMYPLVERAEIPFISLAAGIGIVEPVKKWMFKVAHNDRMAAERVFADAKKRGLTKIALLSETSGFGQSGRKETLAAAPKAGVEIVADETYDPKDTDVTAQLAKIRAIDGVQAIFVFGLGEGPAIVTKNIAQLGIKLPVYHSHGVASQEFIRLAGDAAEGVRFPAAAILVPDQLADSDPQKAVVKDYVALYTAKGNGDISTFGGHARDAFFMWKEAVERAGSVDKAKVRDEIEKTKGFAGTGGLVTMSPVDHLGLSSSAFRMIEIRDGKWRLAQ
ncbi:MAG: ABC transporter substrate-binding protein [Roseiarcus sp.]|jgi:branched-chain amino acid transport system substrate-binding protein